MIGDSVVDIQAAQNAGIRSALTGKLHCYQCRLLAEKGVTPDIYADDLADAVEKILTAGR
jgi:phosphoglycolate phosphatase-like HAD superfamily hydrolase